MGRTCLCSTIGGGQKGAPEDGKWNSPAHLSSGSLASHPPTAATASEILTMRAVFRSSRHMRLRDYLGFVIGHRRRRWARELRVNLSPRERSSPTISDVIDVCMARRHRICSTYIYTFPLHSEIDLDFDFIAPLCEGRLSWSSNQVLIVKAGGTLITSLCRYDYARHTTALEHRYNAVGCLASVAHVVHHNSRYLESLKGFCNQEHLIVKYAIHRRKVRLGLKAYILRTCGPLKCVRARLSILQAERSDCHPKEDDESSLARVQARNRSLG
jgi:hypothetical protein